MSLSAGHDVLHIGLLINPVAGVGGAAALAGSDGTDVQQEARRRGSQPRGQQRAMRFLQAAAEPLAHPTAAQVRWSTWAGAMGEAAFSAVAPAVPGLQWHTLGQVPESTSAEDTVAAAQGLLAAGVDLLVFVGGDGAAQIPNGDDDDEDGCAEASGDGAVGDPAFDDNTGKIHFPHFDAHATLNILPSADFMGSDDDYKLFPSGSTTEDWLHWPDNSVTDPPPPPPPSPEVSERPQVIYENYDTKYNVYDNEPDPKQPETTYPGSIKSTTAPSTILVIGIIVFAVIAIILIIVIVLKTR